MPVARSLDSDSKRFIGVPDEMFKAILRGGR